MRKRMMALAVALLCVFAPAAAFAGDGGLAVSAIGPAATQPTVLVTYPYADEDGDGANDYAVEVGQVANHFKATYATPTSVSEPADGAVTATFKVPQSKYCFYRVSNAVSADAVTYGGYVYSSADRAVTVSAADMRVGDASFDKGTVVGDFSRNAYDTGDLYLNAGPTGHVQLAVGETFSLYPLRSWFPIEGTNNQEPLHPDYYVRVVNLDAAGAVTAVERTTADSGKHKWVITGKKAGTALVMVTYNALVHAGGMGGRTDFGAIWPENTGLFVVTVGKSCDVAGNFTLNAQRNDAYEQANAGKQYYGTAAKLAGNALDAELDVLYYAGDEGARYAFSPEAGAQVSVARGSVADGTLLVGEFTDEGVEVADDGTVTVGGLTTGKHVIRVQKGENVAYQVIRAKAVGYKVFAGDGVDDVGRLVCDSASGSVNAYTNGTASITRAVYDELSEPEKSAYEPLVQPGGKVTVVFDRLYHPANKLQHCYNMTPAISLAGADGAAYGQAISEYGGTGQYLFASTEDCQKIALALSDEVGGGAYALSGALLSLGYGYGGYGAHRAITYEDGIADTTPIAPLYAAYFGQLPEIVLDIVGPEGADDPGPGGDDDAAKRAAEAFEGLVDAIGEVDLDAAGRIAEAREAYDSLSEAALALVEPDAVARLQQAEEQLIALQRAHFEPADIAEGCVRVVIENTTWPESAGAPWEGVLLDEQVAIDSIQDNMRTLADKALEQAGMLGSGGTVAYLNAIEGLGDPESGAACYGDKAGWMVTLNGWFINEGMNAFEGRYGKVREGDEIRLVYSCDGGPDVGSYPNRGTKELASLATGQGTLSPAFGADVAEYELLLPAGTTHVHVKATPKNQNFQARTYLGDADPYEAGYRLNDAIPVQDDSVITVMVGYVDSIDSLSWPSMNASTQPAKTYRITVRIEQEGPDPVVPDDSADEKVAADEKAASDATAAIVKLPEAASVTDADAAAVRKARAAYDALTDDQKALVPTGALAKLVAAEKAVATTITLNTAKVTKTSLAKACRKAGKTPAALGKVVLGKKVKRIAKRTFSACRNARTLVVQTKKLKKSSVKGALKGSAVQSVQVKVGSAKANKKYVKKYRKLFKKKVCGRKCSVS